MSKNLPGSITAYICECGKKWTFLKRSVAGTTEVRHPCACGRTLVVGKGVIYGTESGDRRPRK
jgi:hypothetical protein